MRLASTFVAITWLICVSSGASAAEWSGTMSCGELQNSPNAKSTAGFSGPVILRIDGNKAVLERTMKEGQEHLEGMHSKGMPLQLQGQGWLSARVDRPWKVRTTLTEKGSGYEGSAVFESLDGRTRYRDCSVSLTGTGSSESSQPVGQSSVTREPMADDASTYKQASKQASENLQVASPIPKHLELARELVATVKPENNKYTFLHPKGVQWKGDLFVSENSVDTPCLGFVSAVMARAGFPSIPIRGKNMSNFEEVSKGWHLVQLSTISKVEPGDIFSFRCLKNDDCSKYEVDTFFGHSTKTVVEAFGHVAIIDSKPTQTRPTQPVIDGTLQWLVTVIDSKPGPYDLNDTRSRPKNERQQSGVGRGSFRVYTDLNGVPIGFTKSPNAKKLHMIQERPIAFGHPQP